MTTVTAQIIRDIVRKEIKTEVEPRFQEINEKLDKLYELVTNFVGRVNDI